MKKNKLHLLTLVVCMAFTALAFGSGDDEEAKKDVTKMATEAATISHNFVRAALKAPATADFPTFDFKSTFMGDSTYFVKSYVDAQNSFGANIRTQYQIVLKYKGGDWASPQNWEVIDFKLNE